MGLTSPSEQDVRRGAVSAANQVLPGHQLAVLLYQNQQHLDGLRFQRDDLIALMAADKNMSLPIETELAEFVDDSWLIRGFTCCVRPFYRSSPGPDPSQISFLSIALRALA